MMGATGCPADAVPLPINNAGAFNDGILAMVARVRNYTAIQPSDNAGALVAADG